MFTGNSPRVGAIVCQAGKSNHGITAILRRLAAGSLTLLLITILATAWAFHGHDRVAAWLLMPYALWVSFASFLSFTLWGLDA